MYAIFQSGGKQHQVSEGQDVLLEKINVKVGEIIQFDQILMIFDEKKIEIGNPIVSNRLIKANVISHIKGNKIRIIKFNRRKHYRKTQGHRQWFTKIKILNIL